MLNIFFSSAGVLLFLMAPLTGVHRVWAVTTPPGVDCLITQNTVSLFLTIQKNLWVFPDKYRL